MPKLSHLKLGDRVLISNGKKRFWGYDDIKRSQVRAVHRDGRWYLLNDTKPNLFVRIFLFFFS